jgi:outer membrane protein TolC
MYLKSLLGLALLLCAKAVFAQPEKASQCQGKASSYKELIKCAEELSPEVQKARLELERARAQVGAAGQWKNPELSLASLHGPERASETDLSLGVPIELGGKIQARTHVAESGVVKAEVALLDAQAVVRQALSLKLHRLRQLFHELEVVDESIGTFSKLVAQYASRPKLSPEQEISVSVFRMSKSDYDLKKAELNDEMSGIARFVKTNLGLSIDEVKAAIPPVPREWPTVERSFDLSRSIRVRLAYAEIKSAEAELALAQSEAWPTLTVGPAVKVQNEGGRSDSFFGINVSFPIPLFNLNGAGKEAARAGVTVASASKGFVASEQEKQRDEMVRIYQQSVAILSTTLSHQDIERRHADIERLFFKGVVPSSLVIEAHRTFTDLEKARNERELKTLEALFTIYALDGKTSEF